MTWSFENKEHDYRDYELCLPDVGEHGGRLRLTFALDSGTAYMVLVLDDMDGTHYAEHTINNVPLAWANAIASGVDGFTLTPTEAPTDA